MGGFQFLDPRKGPRIHASMLSQPINLNNYSFDRGGGRSENLRGQAIIKGLLMDQILLLIWQKYVDNCPLSPPGSDGFDRKNTSSILADQKKISFINSFSTTY